MSLNPVEKRRYIRHPSDIPIEVATERAGGREEQLNNISFGGLCFVSQAPIAPGTVISIRITLVRPVFEARGKVVWCSARDGRYDVGVEFVGEGDAFRARMVEQVCHIEQYKREARDKEGRALTGTQAALEWIKKFAKKFPG